LRSSEFNVTTYRFVIVNIPPRNIDYDTRYFKIGPVLAQWRVKGKEGEPTVLNEHLQELLKRYPGIRLLIEDAYFSGRTLCQAITDLNRHYLVRIKGNQPDVEEELETWFQDMLSKKQPPDVTSRIEKKGA